MSANIVLYAPMTQTGYCAGDEHSLQHLKSLRIMVVGPALLMRCQLACPHCRYEMGSGEPTAQVWACKSRDGELWWAPLATLSGYHERTVYSVDWSASGAIASGEALAASPNLCMAVDSCAEAMLHSVSTPSGPMLTVHGLCLGQRASCCHGSVAPYMHMCLSILLMVLSMAAQGLETTASVCSRRIRLPAQTSIPSKSRAFSCLSGGWMHIPQMSIA